MDYRPPQSSVPALEGWYEVWIGLGKECSFAEFAGQRTHGFGKERRFPGTGLPAKQQAAPVQNGLVQAAKFGIAAD